MIPPKEKAQELVLKYTHIGGKSIAKQCALIAVEEILNLDTGDTIDKHWWDDVKSEIEKL